MNKELAFSIVCELNTVRSKSTAEDAEELEVAR